MSKRVLIVEDDTALARVLRDNLAYEGFQVDSALDGRDALAKISQFRPDLVVLDIRIPILDGFEVCRHLREGNTRTPIIILTAKSQKEDKIRGLELGADDYVTKPFALDELLARVHAVLRRSYPKVDRLKIGDLAIDFRARRASKGHHEIGFTHREFELLHYLAERPGQSATRDELLQHVWGYSSAPLSRAVDNVIARLRRKIEPDPHRPRYLRTAHGDGYCLTLET